MGSLQKAIQGNFSLAGSGVAPMRAFNPDNQASDQKGHSNSNSGVVDLTVSKSIVSFSPSHF